MFSANQNVPNPIRPASGVEQITEGYYRFHLPDVADNIRVQKMMKVFEKASREGAHQRSAAQDENSALAGLAE
jgi:hypothetical protein